MVIQFRLNPEDVMSCIDVIDQSKIYSANMSLPMVCRLVLSAYLQKSRDLGHIPVRDGYEYSSMIARFSNMSQAKKISVTSNIQLTDAKNHANDEQGSYIDIQRRNELKQHPQQFNTPSDVMIRKRGRVELAIDELEQRRTIDDENFSKEQHTKLVALQSALIQLNNDVDVDIRALLE